MNVIKSLVWILFTVGLAVITQNISKNVIFSIAAIGIGSLIFSLMTKSVNSFFYCFYLSFSVFNVINYIFLNPQNAYKISHLNGTLVDFVMVIIFGIFQITYMVLEYVYTNKKIITTTNIKWSICAVCIFVLILFLYKLFVCDMLYNIDAPAYNKYSFLYPIGTYLLLDIVGGGVIGLIAYISLNFFGEVDKSFYIRLVIPMIFIHSEFYQIIYEIIKISL